MTVSAKVMWMEVFIDGKQHKLTQWEEEAAVEGQFYFRSVEGIGSFCVVDHLGNPVPDAVEEGN